MIKIAPSLLAADMGDLRKQVALVEAAGAEYLHLDIMDGAFVPNISYGAAVVKALRGSSNLFFDVHLMVEEPSRFFEDFANAGADLLCVHQEACTHLHRNIQLIHGLGLKAGVALNPATSLSAIEEVLEDVDMVLLMSVNPGFGGQSFIESTLAKITKLRTMLQKKKLLTDIEVDGGVYEENVQAVVAAGANVLVAGTAIFGKPNLNEAIKIIRERGMQGLKRI